MFCLGGVLNEHKLIINKSVNLEYNTVANSYLQIGYVNVLTRLKNR